MKSLDSIFRGPNNYIIKVKGIVTPGLSEFLGGMTIENELARNQTTIYGMIQDQSELLGILDTLAQHQTKILSVQIQ